VAQKQDPATCSNNTQQSW